MGLIDPGEGGFAITPNDNADLSRVTRKLYVGTQGDIQVTLANDDTIIFPALAAGIFHRLRVKRVLSTGTSASGIVGVY
jgi:hypothetical protein